MHKELKETMYKDTAATKKLIRERYKQVYALKFDNLQK